MIDGGGIRPYGIVVIADGVRVENLTVTGATFYGVLFTGLHDANGPSAHTADGYHAWDPSKFPPLQRFRVDHVTAHNNGLYGIYAFNARHGVITDSYASGSADSGIYVGQCTECDILVSGNVAERNAVGFENANASDSVVLTGNRFSDNRVGLTLLSSYQEAFTPQQKNQVVGNLISDNNEADSPSQADGGFGTGIGISGGQRNTDRTQPDHRPPARRRGADQHRGPAGHEEHLQRQRATTTTRSTWRTSRPLGPRPPATAPTMSRRPRRRRCSPELRSACAGRRDREAVRRPALAGPEAPPGQSYKKVAAPLDQPSSDRRRVATASHRCRPRSPCPTCRRHRPAADLLESNAGTR